MFGNHDIETALKIADEKTKELGVTCAVFPCGDEAPGLYTIGVPIPTISGQKLEELLKRK